MKSIWILGITIELVHLLVSLLGGHYISNILVFSICECIF